MAVNPNWSIGRTGLVYVGEEATYAAAPTLLATNAVRDQGIKLKFNPRNLALSPERHVHPSKLAVLARRQTGEWDLKAQMYPSGVLNTLPEIDLLLKNSLGNAASNITLSTVFTGTPSTTGGTVSSATGLAPGQPVQVTVGSGAGAGVHVRWLTSATSGTALVWAPALPSAPAAGDALKGTVGYSLSTALSKSLDIAHYPQAPASGAPAREMLGCVCDKVSIMFDSNLEPMIDFSGPSQGYAGTSPSFTPQSAPGGYTTVGAEGSIPSGITGYFQLGAVLYEVEKLQIDITNGMILKSTAFGTSKASGFERTDTRSVTVKINAKVSDDLTLWTPSLASTSNAAMLQIGATSARMWGVYLPALVIMDNPDTPDSDQTNNWDFTCQALGVSGNDEFYLAAA